MLFDLFGYQFHIFEIPLIVFLMAYFSLHFILGKEKVYLASEEDKRYFKLLWIGFFLLFVSKIISFWPAIDKVQVLSDLLKWTEIVLFALLVYHFQYFTVIFWILFSVNFFPVLFSSYSAIINFNFFSGYRIFPGYPGVFTLSLLLPFYKKNILIMCACIYLIVINVLSITRGAWAAMLLILGYYLCFNFKSDKKSVLRVAGIILIVILVVISIPAVKNNITSRTINPFLLSSTSNYSRSGMIKFCLEIFKKNPIMGIGSGNFAAYAAKNSYLYVGKYLEIAENMAPHAFFIQLLAENGIFGFIAMAMIFLILAKVLFEEKRYLKYRDGKEYILGLRMFYLSFMIHLIFGYVAGSSRLIFGLLMGLSLSLLKKDHRIDSIKS